MSQVIDGNNMNLLRFYFMIGGRGFDAESYMEAACANGFAGEVSYIKNPTLTTRDVNNKIVESKFSPNMPGTKGDGYRVWRSTIEDYAKDEIYFLEKNNLHWAIGPIEEQKNENFAMILFLERLKNNLPLASDYCVDEYFILFKIIYGYLDDEVRVFPGFSRELIKILGELGAGLETDCESVEVHFSRLAGAGRQ